MSFHFGTEETVLFDWWTFSTTSGLVYSMIGIFLMATLYEGLKYYRLVKKYEFTVLII